MAGDWANELADQLEAEADWGEEIGEGMYLRHLADDEVVLTVLGPAGTVRCHYAGINWDLL